LQCKAEGVDQNTIAQNNW